MTRLRVCVDARLGGGMSGGVEQFVIGLAAAFSRLTDGDEEYLFLAHPEEDDWIKGYVGGPCRVLHTRMEYPGQRRLGRSLVRGLQSRAPMLSPSAPKLLDSDGVAESSGAGVVHFPMQEAFVTRIPSIYHPHDLQHVHLPELFSAEEKEKRDLLYRSFCERASAVVMMTRWGRRDLHERYGVPMEKIHVIPWGSVVSEYPSPADGDLDRLRREYALPPEFLLYPAQSWPHKNHLRLLEALALLRDRDGVTVPVVCPGRRNDHYPAIAERARELGLSDSVVFPGFVDPSELRALYALALGLVFPSLFEGWGMPVSEAFASGVPVASSSATGLPEVLGDAALVFDPSSVEEMAGAIKLLWEDPELRRSLSKRGTERAREFSIDRSARVFRALYRQVAAGPLSEEDRILLHSSAGSG